MSPPAVEGQHRAGSGRGGQADTLQRVSDMRDLDWYLGHFRMHADALADAIEAGPPDVPIAACPGWDLSQLAKHVGQVHRWAAFCVREGRAPSREEAGALGAFEPDGAADWYRESASIVADALDGIDVTAPTWHPFPTDQVAGFWPRRMAHEVVVHRRDADLAIGRATDVDAELASDGIDEYFEVTIPRKVADGAELPTGSFHVHCTDVDGEWLVWAEDGEYRMIREHQKGDAALRGPAAQIFMRLWNRDAPDDELSPVGDEAVLLSWTSLGGN